MSSGRFKLQDSDLISATWSRMRRHLEERLQALRAQNENPALDATETAVLRGRIAELKLLLTAAEPDPPPIDFN